MAVYDGSFNTRFHLATAGKCLPCRRGRAYGRIVPLAAFGISVAAKAEVQTCYVQDKRSSSR